MPRGDSDGPSAYYVASGERVPLAPTDEVAVDVSRAEQSDLAPQRLASLRRDGRTVNDGLFLLGNDQLEASERASLEQISALQPVYEAGGARIIVLPEVRVEVSGSHQERELERRVAEGDGTDGGTAQLVEQRPGRYVITMERGTGDDALSLANDLAESLHPDLAQARFIRITDRPDGTVKG
ncbi:MAG: hypothetical protein ACRDZ2_11075 [Ilumatobacteraceae bacterium]